MKSELTEHQKINVLANTTAQKLTLAGMVTVGGVAFGHFHWGFYVLATASAFVVIWEAIWFNHFLMLSHMTKEGI